MDLLEKLGKKAKKYGAEAFGLSGAKTKRYYVIYNNKIINFGLKNGDTYVDHNDKNKRKAWRARHSKILLKDGSPAYKNKSQASFWSYHILW